MKKLAFTGIATLALVAGAFAQGLVAIDDSANANGVADVTAGSYYSGTFGMEVWESSATSVPAGLNAAAPLTAYGDLTTDGFKKEVTYANQTMSQGTFTLGTATLPDVTPAGSSVVLALAVWNNSQATWTLGVAQSGAHAGVPSFVNPTVAPTSSGPPPTPASLSGWTTGDLVMTSVGSIVTTPEPGTLALLGLGAVSLLIIRRRK